MPLRRGHEALEASRSAGIGARAADVSSSVTGITGFGL
ncbi:hypothetical protein SCE1572_23165 [Sorangium cellulosum So0157-2]|uniref:Uncharacterized protein n=1 Tax=Sorangium cellulosum So0157-2 TaxID=1254432 RepID=S4XXP1_SORCE|nr:hypothetical protein SCE1572_23165 [Sorangium cellulosum So0157-2]